MMAPARQVLTHAFGGFALTLSVLAFTVAWAPAAIADAPITSDWPPAPERSVLDAIVLFGGSVVGLFLLVALFGLITARNNYVPPKPSVENEIEADDHVALPHGSPAQGADGQDSDGQDPALGLATDRAVH